MQRAVYREKVRRLGDGLLREGKESEVKHDSRVGALRDLGTKDARRSRVGGGLMSLAWWFEFKEMMRSPSGSQGQGSESGLEEEPASKCSQRSRVPWDPCCLGPGIHPAGHSLPLRQAMQDWKPGR